MRFGPLYTSKEKCDWNWWKSSVGPSWGRYYITISFQVPGQDCERHEFDFITLIFSISLCPLSFAPSICLVFYFSSLSKWAEISCRGLCILIVAFQNWKAFNFYWFYYQSDKHQHFRHQWREASEKRAWEQNALPSSIREEREKDYRMGVAKEVLWRPFS